MRLPLLFIMVVAAEACSGGQPRSLAAADVADDVVDAGPEQDQKLEATVSGCRDVTTWDNGHVVSVVVERGCSLPGGPVTIEMGVTGADQVEFELVHGGKIEAVIPGIGPRQIGLHRQGDWVSFANEDSWAPRDGAGLLELDGALYLLGGWLHGPTCSPLCQHG